MAELLTEVFLKLLLQLKTLLFMTYETTLNILNSQMQIYKKDVRKNI